MTYTMVIPSYWARDTKVDWQEGDAIYDHPTPLDQNGTLPRLLNSMKILKERDFRLVVIAVPTSERIINQVEEKVSHIIKIASAEIGIKVSLFGPSHLKQIHNVLITKGKERLGNLLKLRGYSNVRNICLFIPHIFDSEATVLIDDDEVFEDSAFMTKVKEFIGKDREGSKINAIAGYYLQPNGNYRLKKVSRPWVRSWGQYDIMNTAFDKVIGSEPRLKETPFVFGGNMVIYKDLFRFVPFDPMITRGEDLDYLINAKMYGFPFFLDNQLAIRHLPPPKTHPDWMQLRQDIFRFIYEKSKIEHQKEMKGMTRVSPEDFDPYPGHFLGSNLMDKIVKACQLLSHEYLKQGDKISSKAALSNIELAGTYVASRDDPFQALCKLQRDWQHLIDYTSQREVNNTIREIIKGGFSS